MPKSLVTSLQGKQQQSCIHLLYKSLVGQFQYTSQPKGSFWYNVIETNGAIFLIDIHK